MKVNKFSIPVITVLLLITPAGFSAEMAEQVTPVTMEIAYPNLASGALSFAVAGDLPEGILLLSGAIEVTTKELDLEILKITADIREEMKKNQFFLLEQLAAKDLLLHLARTKSPQSQQDKTPLGDNKQIQDYLKEIVSAIAVTDQEIADFYTNNKDICGNTPLDQMKDQIKEYILQEKQQNAVKEHIRTLGQRIPITVSARWAKEQAIIAKENPVDQARSNGLPSMVDFGASGCRPCDMMTPILADLKKKFDGKLNVVFIHVRGTTNFGHTIWCPNHSCPGIF